MNIHALLQDWGLRWGLPDLGQSVKVEWGRRFRRSLGRCISIIAWSAYPWNSPRRRRGCSTRSYIVHHSDGAGVAFVGSSNLSGSALGSGIEWNYRVVPARDRAGFSTVVAAFEALFPSACKIGELTDRRMPSGTVR